MRIPPPELDSEEAEESWGAFSPISLDPSSRHAFLEKETKKTKTKKEAEHRSKVHAAFMENETARSNLRLAEQEEAKEFDDLGKPRKKDPERIAELLARYEETQAHLEMLQSPDYEESDEEEEEVKKFRDLPISVEELKGLTKSRGTLVICPVSLVGQWVTEAKSKLNVKGFTIHEYYGAKRQRDVKMLAQYDLVVSTYETLVTDMRRYLLNKDDKKPAVLLINWHRVVFDESHRAKAAKGIIELMMAIVSKRRWAVSGTPMNTAISDLAGQCRSLGLLPLGDPIYWDILAGKKTGNARYSRRAILENSLSSESNGYSAILAILRRVLLRHGKSMKYAKGEEDLLSLPPKSRPFNASVSPPKMKACSRISNNTCSTSILR